MLIESKFEPDDYTYIAMATAYGEVTDLYGAVELLSRVQDESQEGGRKPGAPVVQAAWAAVESCRREGGVEVIEAAVEHLETQRSNLDESLNAVKADASSWKATT